MPERKNSRSSLYLLAATTWMAIILGLYYWVHKPITPALAAVIGSVLLSVTANLVFVLAAAGLGHRALRSLDLQVWSRGERFAGTVIVGLGILSLLMLAVGLVALHPISMAGLLIVVVAGLRRDIMTWLVASGSARPGKLPPRGWSRFLALASVSLVLIAFVLATLPPTAWDVLTYHLAGAEAYVQEGRFYAVPHNHFLGFPQLVDTLYAGQLAITRQLNGGGLLHWTIGVLMLIFTGSHAARHAGTRAGWLAVIALLSSITIWLEMTFAYVDLMLMALSIIGLAALESWSQQRDRAGWLVLLGLLAGFAMGTKYTAIWLALAFGLMILWYSRRDGVRMLAYRALVFGGTAALIMLPWLIRNMLWYDNPVYPFVFEAGEMDAIRQDWYSDPGSGLIYGSNAWQVPLMPLMATIMGVEGGEIYSSDIGPLFALLLPIGLLAWPRLRKRERATLRRTLALAGLLTLFWMVSGAWLSYINIQTRLVLFIFPLLAVACGMIAEGLSRLPEKPLNFAFVAHAMITMVVVFTLTNVLREMAASGVHIPYAGEDNYRDRFLAHTLGWHYEAMRQVNALPEDSTVRFLWEPRYLYCDSERINCRPDSLMDSWYHARRVVPDGDPDAIADMWQSDGQPDYLLVYEFGRRYEERHQDLYTSDDWAAWEAFVDDHLNVVWQGGNTTDEIQYIIYTWQTAAGAS